MRLSNLKSLAAAAAIALSASSAMAGTFYGTEALFTAAIQPGAYIENFSSFTFGNPLNGSQLSYVAPGGGGFGWTASAALGLYSNNSALSTNTAQDPLTITFSTPNVTALGGNFTNTDISGAVIPGTVTITTSDGGVQTVTNPTAASFLGYTSAVPIVSVTIVSAGATNNWPQVDHFYTGLAAGGVVPEPASLGVAAMGLGLIAARRRRA